MLAYTIYISFLGAAALLLLPKRATTTARILALLTATAAFAIALASFLTHRTGEMQTITRTPWIPSLGIEYHLAADGISVSLVLLTGIIAITGVLFSWNVGAAAESNARVPQFFSLYLLLIGAVYGVFLSADIFLLFVFYEIVIIPKYFLIAIWGSTRKEYGAMKLALYSFIGSALVLIGIIAAYVAAGARTTDIATLAHFPFPHHFQMLAFPLVFVGFAILAGLWPFHTWAPTGHVAAPTAASMLLAGVVMKLGAYGCLRVAMVLFPQGLTAWSHPVLGLTSWRDTFALLAVIGIVYGALVALVQKDFKFVIGYSSVSHMGFILLGLMTLNQLGLAGAILQMISHGLLAGLLFAIVGRMVYARTHTREFYKLGPLNLSCTLPFAAVTFVLAGMAAMGLPGFSGFVAELMILIGTWRTYPLFALATGFGILIGVIYIWRAMQKAFFTDAHTSTNPGAPFMTVSSSCVGSDAQQRTTELPPITLPEKIGAIILITSSIAVGLYPQMLLNIILPALNSPLFAPLRTGSWQ
ncbi:MAG TPA: NADH-quinone oxidoreductase subunit M [Acidobacteriaceae bacterium]|nr:NADH-quinone oxidoreductase subunit M [Acidobacteriaceae bacterium]